MQFKKIQSSLSDQQLDYIGEDSISGSEIDFNQLTWAESRVYWKRSKKPFLNVFPTIERALLKSKLNIDPSMVPKSCIHELRALEVRFKTGREPFMLSITEPRTFSTRGGEVLGRTNGLAVSRMWREPNAQGKD